MTRGSTAPGPREASRSPGGRAQKSKNERKVVARVLASLICLGNLAPSFATDEVVITGTRIPQNADESPEDVKVYTRDRIDRSGGTTLAEFLNTLPDVSLSITENGFQTPGASTTVRLHGLPIGTTLVLVNGRRVENSGVGQLSGLTYFDLNTIPLAAIDRIELVSQGSSAIYGSDAIAGVMNIILKNRFNGFEVNSKYGFASGTHQDDADLTWGSNWDKGSFMAVATYQTRTALTATDRALTSDQDYRALGGQDADFYMCPDQANVYSRNGANLPGLGATYAAVPGGYTGVPSRQEFATTAGTLNRCSLFKYVDLIPSTERTGLLLQGNYEVAPQAELYSNVLFSHVEQFAHNAPPILFGEPAFQQYTVSAANPFNPFGVAIGVSDMLPSFGRTIEDTRTNYLDVVVGSKGTFFNSWHWDLAASDSEDRTRYTQSGFNGARTQAALNSSNPATALDPFIAAPPAPTAFLQSLVTGNQIDSMGRAVVANATVRGPVAQLPGGPLSVALGAEYERDTLFQNQFIFPGPVQVTNFHRTSYALFGEARVPVLGPADGVGKTDRFDVTLAGRFDHYDDFGSETTPQFGLELRPFEPLLVRASYSRAFRAPDLIDLYAATYTSDTALVQDPLRGNAFETVVATLGGNRALRPEKGLTRTVGLVYAADFSGPLRLAVTYWEIDETNAIQQFSPQVIVANASLFPGDVVRAATCAGGPPCPVTAVTATYQNFGRIEVAGLDYQVTYQHATGVGTFAPSISASQTYRYAATLTPNSPAVTAVSVAQDTGNWAPRWKGTAAIDWRLAGWEAYLAGRYVGRYRDYDSQRSIGNFWLVDTSIRYSIGQTVAPDSSYWRNLYVSLGAMNLFNKLPQFSNFESDFVGYDPTQADIRGRFSYAQLGVRW